MVEIIGPFSQRDFENMQRLKSSISFYRSEDPKLYREALQRETAMLKGDKYFGRRLEAA